jgi:hypothetical protein
MSTSTLPERVQFKFERAIKREIGRTAHPSKPSLRGEVQSPDDLLHHPVIVVYV